MKPPPTIKASDMLADLAKLMPKGGKSGNGMTTTELVEASGWPRERIIKLLQAAKKAGKLQAEQVVREAISGRMSTTTAYRIIK